MKVEDNNKELQNYSKSLDKKLQKEIASKDNQILNIKKFYDKKVENSKTQGEENYTNSLSHNDGLLLNASKEYEDKLNIFKTNLEKTQQNVEKEQLQLRSGHEEIMSNLKDQNRNNVHNEYVKANDNLSSIQNLSHNSAESISDKFRSERNHLENSSRSEINALSSQYNQDGVATEREYRANLDNNIQNHKADLLLQKTELKKIMDKTTEENKRLESEKIKTQTAEINYLDNHQKSIILQKQNDFKIRYEHLVKEHDALLLDLKTRFESDVTKMIESTSSKKQDLSNKVSDQFYRVETLKPNISENEKEYMVSINVPVHEKENVHLSVQGRGVKLTLTRKFAEGMEEKDGSYNKSNRNELFSKEFRSKDILNPKEIVQNYENGILSYKVKKL